MALDVIYPGDGCKLRSHAEHLPRDVEARLARASSAFEEWRSTPLNEKSRLLREAAKVLLTRRERYSRTITEEMGKPIAAAEAEVEKCALACDHYAEHAARYLAVEPAPSDARESFVRHEPLGLVLAVMPWNFPFWQVFRFCAPALAAGNVALLKHASNVPGCALGIEEALRDAGFPAGCFQALLIRSAGVEGVIRDPRVSAVTLTGSEAAGARVAAIAGDEVKKTVLELGGSDPFLVLADADLERAAAAAVASRTMNCGQSCIAAKRFIVEEPAGERFAELFQAGLERLRIGDPLERTTELGPLARGDLVEDIDRQVRESLHGSARLRCGGKRLERPGFFYAPTLITGVGRGFRVWDEETFGPVAALALARDAEDALRLANDSRFGLGASLWTRDLERAKDLAARIEAGCVFVNGIVKSDPRLPFGGIKKSGYGRELGRQGLLEFVNTKTVWVG